MATERFVIVHCTVAIRFSNTYGLSVGIVLTITTSIHGNIHYAPLSWISNGEVPAFATSSCRAIPVSSTYMTALERNSPYADDVEFYISDVEAP